MMKFVFILIASMFFSHLSFKFSNYHNIGMTGDLVDFYLKKQSSFAVTTIYSEVFVLKIAKELPAT